MSGTSRFRNTLGFYKNYILLECRLLLWHLTLTESSQMLCYCLQVSSLQVFPAFHHVYFCILVTFLAHYLHLVASELQCLTGCHGTPNLLAFNFLVMFLSDGAFEIGCILVLFQAHYLYKQLFYQCMHTLLHRCLCQTSESL